MDQSNWQNWIDKTIQEAYARGLFDNLGGKGRPIKWDDESLVDEEWAVAFRLMREHGFAPEWIELHKEIEAELKKAREAVRQAWQWRQERLVGARESERRYVENEWRRARSAFTATVAELNTKIANFNLIVPIANLQKPKLSVADELAALAIEM